MVKTGIQTIFFLQKGIQKILYFLTKVYKQFKNNKNGKKIEAKKHTRALSRQKKNYVYMKWVNDVFDRLIYYTISLYHKNHLFKQNGERVFFINSSDTAIL
jgi:prophage maintenance system killer protein